MSELHAHYSPSSAERLFNCPSSFKLSEGLPNRSSVYATMGTDFHEHAAKFLLGEIDAVDSENFPGLSLYTKWCSNLMDLAKDHGGRYWVEERTFVTDALHGTPDFAAVVADTLHVVDLKAGYLDVPVENNKQLLYYALGLTLQHQLEYDSCVLTIVQPRIPHTPIKTFTVSREDVLNFLPALMSAVALAEEGKAELKLGDHCKYCPATPVCSARKKEMKIMLELSDKLDEADLGWVLDHAPSVSDYIDQVKELAIAHPPKGWKVAEGIGKRVWKKGVQLPDSLMELSPITFSKADKLGVDLTPYADIKVGSPRLVRSESTNLFNN